MRLLFLSKFFVDLLHKLLEKGAQINQEALNLYDAKINALIIATESGSFSCVKCLVENGLDVNYRIDGKVSLVDGGGVFFVNEEVLMCIFQILILKGETAGRTPLFCASVKNHPEIVEYLIEHEANVNASEDVSYSVFFDHLVRYTCTLSLVSYKVEEKN